MTVLLVLLISLPNVSVILAFFSGTSFLRNPTKLSIKLNDAVPSERNFKLLPASRPRSQNNRGREHYSTSSLIDIKVEEPTSSNYTSVQRTYETYRWKDKYNINFRAEGPVGGRPILLVHGFGANVVSGLSFGFNTRC